MYKHPSWYKNKKLDLAKITDQQLIAFRDEMNRIHHDNKLTYELDQSTIKKLLIEAQTIYDAKHSIVKAIRKSLNEWPIPPSYEREFSKLHRAIQNARHKMALREQARQRRAEREAELARQREQRRAKQRDYYRQHKQLLIDLREAAILECGDEAGPYQLESSELKEQS